MNFQRSLILQDANQTNISVWSKCSTVKKILVQMKISYELRFMAWLEGFEVRNCDI